MYKLFDIAKEPRINGSQELYFRRNGNRLAFDTYFNVLPVSKLKKYTNITELVFSQPVDICTEHGRIMTGERIPLREVPDNAELLYIETNDSVNSLSVYAVGEHRLVRPAIIICTYHREEQLRDNIDYLLKYIDDTAIEIIIVDNGSTVPIHNWKSDRITVLHNSNSGGSGGYAHGMRYAAEQKRFTHMILMDDDVTFDFVSIQKLSGFLFFLKDEYADISVAGSMLNVDDPKIQFECGGYFSQDGMQTGHGYDFDLTDRDRLIENEVDKQINYGGWWLMCMPMRYAEEGQYPAPFFIKYDDVEYALRCGLSIVTLNGVGVWHENFGNKYNSVQEYFNTRNYLFLMKRHLKDFTSEKAYKAVRYLLLEKLCRQQYKMAEAVLIAYDDYLKGEEYLSRIDYDEKLSQLRKLNYEMLSEDELFKSYGIRFDEQLYNKCSGRRFKKYMQPLLYGHLIPPFLCRKLTITDVISDRKEHYFRAGKTLHFSRYQKCGYVTESDFIQFIYKIIKLKRR